MPSTGRPDVSMSARTDEKGQKRKFTETVSSAKKTGPRIKCIMMPITSRVKGLYEGQEMAATHGGKPASQLSCQNESNASLRSWQTPRCRSAPATDVWAHLIFPFRGLDIGASHNPTEE